MNFSSDDITSVWVKGWTVLGNDPDFWRKDQCGAWIGKSYYGKKDIQYGWEIDHIDTNTSNNALTNLRPLQWENNASRQDNRLTCPIISNGINNVRR
jgi:hypothetical protein